MRVLIAYGTTQGQTARIANRICVRLREAGIDVIESDIRAIRRGASLDGYDAFLVAGSLHAQGYQRRVKRFIRENLGALHSRPTAFVSVCMAIASRFPEDRKEAAAIPRRFAAGLGWTPDEIAVFAGALAFTKYGFFTRFFMRRIAEKELQRKIDTTVDHEFTNWADVDAFAAAFARRLERRRLAVALLHPEPGKSEVAVDGANA